MTRPHDRRMGDFLTIIGVLAFLFVMLGLIKGLEHV
jgi:hypothetical protein